MTVTPIGMTSRSIPSLDPRALQQISAAVHARETLRFDYLAAGEDASEPTAAPRRAQPHHVVARGGRWYVIAWDLDRDDWRTFRADRMSLRSPNGPRFTPRALPGGDVAAYVTGQFRGSGPGGDWGFRGSAVVVDAERISPYLEDSTLEALADGRSRVHLGAWSWSGLAATFARLEVEMNEVEPAELRDAFAALATRASRASAHRVTAAGVGTPSHDGHEHA